jgi:2-polyprenyl-6-methoxyphenol hydroxylase-like FAD-dependent oxidoreductase
MADIGIIGAGIAGLHLGLFLQKQGVAATLYTEKTAGQILAGRLPSVVTRLDHTRQRERALGVDHWDDPGLGVFCIHFYAGGEQPIAFRGDFAQPGSTVDMRLYCATLLRDFEERGGQVVAGAVQAADVAELSERHDLMVVSSGRGSLADLFPRLPERSPYTAPQRLLCAGIFRGIACPDPRGVSYHIAPGQGEIFESPIYGFEPGQSALLFEGIPGGAFEVLMKMRYEDGPSRFEKTVLHLLRQHAPATCARINPRRFALIEPQDLLQGAITPTVRRGYAPLGNGKFALALGDAHVVNDPILGQGANAASYAAWTLGKAIVEDIAFDEWFCHGVEQRLWEYLRDVTEWTNFMLQPPPPHVLGLLAAAARDQAVADAFVNNFNAPRRGWEMVATPEGAASFLCTFGAKTLCAVGVS